jgi:calmodulin
MADLIPGKKVNLFLDSFNALADKDGILPIRLLGALLRSVGENPTQVEVQDMVNEVDKEATGIVRFPDFLYMMASKVKFGICRAFNLVNIESSYSIFYISFHFL